MTKRPALRALAVSVVWLPAFSMPGAVSAQDFQTAEVRPMSFLDMQHMRRAGSFTPSPDGQWLTYTVATPDWQEDERQSDLYLVSTGEGLESTRQMTFTEDSDESSPQWSKDGMWIAFLSDRDAKDGKDTNQLYAIRPNGGEARKLTDAEDGVSDFAFSDDGQWLVYESGKGSDAQLYRVSVLGMFTVEAEQLTDLEAGVERWQWAPTSDRIYYTTPDEARPDEEERKEMGFTVDVKNAETPLSSLWALDLDPHNTVRLTEDDSYSVAAFSLSDDGAWLGFNGGSAERYERNITEARINADLFLLETATGHIERLTENSEVGESGLTFSPDGERIAFSAPSDMTRYTMTNRKVYVRAVEDRGGQFTRRGDDWDGHMSVGFWSEDGETIYFNGGVRATRQLLALDVGSGEVEQVTNEAAALAVVRDDDTGVLMVNYEDPATPSTLFTVAGLDQLDNRAAWTQLTDANPEVRGWALGEEEEITWTSTDGKEVAGVLVKPVGFSEGQRYPLIVAIHGGPASADVLRFNGGYGAQVYAGAGYMVLKPNYRGSDNYGEEHRTSIVGNYFPQGYDDIMTGVDHLIAEGMVDGDRMGALGWSAGGHWSNWILTHTDRFKAISSGAGTMNWISMYAQSDVQRNRQFYLGDNSLYEDFDSYWEQSPIQYMKDASTPTMVHVVAGDPRVPSPQSVELHMALKKLGIDTELFMYPGQSHGIPDARNRLVKSVSEMKWMDYYVRGMGEKFAWQDVLRTLEAEKEAAKAATDGRP